VLSRVPLILAAVAALLLVPGSVAGPRGGAATAFVTAEDDDAVVAVDLASGRIVRRIPVADGPHNIDVSWNGRFVVATSPPAGRVTLISGWSLRVLHVFSGFGSPHDVELSDSGRYAYVTDEGRGEVAVLDLVTRRIVRRVAVAAGPHDLAVSSTLIWVTHGRRTTFLTLLDFAGPDNPARPRSLMRVAMHGAPHDISHQPDSANVYVTYWDSPFVGKIDGRLKLRFRRDVGANVHHVAFDYFSGRRLWVTDHSTGHVLLLSARNGRVLRTSPGCPGVHHVALAPGRVAVACHDTGRLLVLSRKLRPIKSLPVGRGLHGVAIAVMP
jgi:YVTN family beta-propeller protein